VKFHNQTNKAIPLNRNLIVGILDLRSLGYMKTEAENWHLFDEDHFHAIQDKWDTLHTLQDNPEMSEFDPLQIHMGVDDFYVGNFPTNPVKKAQPTKEKPKTSTASPGQKSHIPVAHYKHTDSSETETDCSQNDSENHERDKCPKKAKPKLKNKIKTVTVKTK
jgi:hypothetical protein